MHMARLSRNFNFEYPLGQREREADETKRQHEREIREATEATATLRKTESDLVEQTRLKEDELAATRPLQLPQS